MTLENRISGFASANSKKFESVNSAYKHFLNAIGDDAPQTEKPDFKEFLETAKKTGELENMLKVEGVKEKTTTDTKVDAPLEKKSLKNPAKTIGLIVLGVAIVGTVIYFATRTKKQ